MKNLPLIIISLILVIGVSIIVFINLPEDTNTNNNIQTNSINNNTSNPTPNDNNKPTSNSDELNQLTLQDVATHNTRDDCYLVIRNNVYDVSNFIDSHPGGVQRISEQCGKEVSGLFAQIHSNRAWDLLVDYKIGNLQN